MIVLDTNVVSLIIKSDDRASYYLRRIGGMRPFISFQTLEELWHWAYSRNWGARRKNELERHLERYQVVWPDSGLVDICARLRRQRQAWGRRLERADAWIAATALYLDCPLASHDGDFDDIPQLRLVRASVSD